MAEPALNGKIVEVGTVSFLPHIPVKPLPKLSQAVYKRLNGLLIIARSN